MAFAKGRVSLTRRLVSEEDQRPAARTGRSPRTSGFTCVFDNVGNVINRGLELGLTTVNVDSRKADGFRWTTTLNLGFNRNK